MDRGRGRGRGTWGGGRGLSVRGAGNAQSAAGRGSYLGFRRGGADRGGGPRGRGGHRGIERGGAVRGRGGSLWRAQRNDYPTATSAATNVATLPDSSEDASDMDEDDAPKARPARHTGADAEEIKEVRRNAGGFKENVKTVVTSNGSEVPERMNNKVFIDGLPFSNTPESCSGTLEDELRKFTSDWKVGKVMKLIKRDGQGFGYLAFRSPHSVDVAIRILNGRKFLGRPLRVELPKPRDLAVAGSQFASEQDVVRQNFNRQVLLSDLSKIAEPEIIREVLRDVAPQLEQKIEAIKMAGRNRKAFLTMAAEEDVTTAVGFLNGFTLLGRKICAERAMAPGSLPFSRTAAPATAKAAVESLPRELAAVKAGAASPPKMSALADDDDDVVAPLGVAASATPTTATAAKVKSLDPAPVKATNSRASAPLVAGKFDFREKGPKEIFVGNLGDDVTSEQLRQHFSSCGTIVSCELLTNPATHLPVGIAKVVFSHAAFAAYAKNHLHGSRLRGHVLRVDRGEESSAPLALDVVVEAPEVDDYDEDAFVKHYGVTDRKAFFKGTSLEESGEGDQRMQGKKQKRDDATATPGETDANPRAAKAKKIDSHKLARGSQDAAPREKPHAKKGKELAKPKVQHANGGRATPAMDDEEDERFVDVDVVKPKAVKAAKKRASVNAKKTVPRAKPKVQKATTK